MTYGKVNDIIMRDIVDPEYEDYKENIFEWCIQVGKVEELG